ncbi:MAG: NAD-binding protein [Pseudomonadota bacterium]
MAEKVFELGDQAGAGSAMKAVNQLLAGVHIATMAEALTFGMTQGVAPEKFLEVISQCAGSSWMLENRAPHIISGDYNPHSQVNIWGAVVIACATVPPDFAKEMEARCAAQGVHYLDAPISGGSIKAADGALSIMAAGTAEAFAAARPVLDAIAEKVFELGDQAGAGSAMKAVNQLLAGVHIATMAEALTFGMTQGVAPEKFLEVISQCAGSSWMLENRAPHIISGDYSPHSQVNIWPKDLGIVLDIAKSAQFSAPITAAALQQYLAAAGMGLGHEDDAAVAKVYARNAGLKLPGEK